MFMVKIARPPLEISFEAGSVSEAIGQLTESGPELAKMFEIPLDGSTAPPEKKRGRPPAKPPEAPAPAPIPGVQVPAFVQPPPLPAAPPIAPPPAPPVAGGRLGPLVAAEIKKRGEGSADGGKALVEWLAKAGAIVPGATFAEALACLPLAKDDTLQGVAKALGVE